MNRLLRWVGGALLVLLLLGGGVLWVGDTSIGHRFIVERVAAIAPKSGLRIKIGRIDGSIYGKSVLRNVRLYDSAGLFFDASKVELEWMPLGWLNNRLDIDNLNAPLATLHKIPKFAAVERTGSILPGFDIDINSVGIDVLRIEAPVTGVRRVGKLAGAAHVARGRARINLTGNTDSGDSARIKLDAQPDRNLFDLEANIIAPERGIIGAIAGIKQPFALRITGDGKWTAWQGQATAIMAGKRIADFSLRANAGVFGIDGALAVASLTKGTVQRLSNPILRVSARGTLKQRRLDGEISVNSAAIVARASGLIDLGTNRFNAVTIDAKLLQSQALFTTMTGGPLMLKAQLDGAFKTAQFDYLLTAPRLVFGQTGFENARVSGRGRLSAAPVTVPLLLTASRVTGVGTVAGGILANLRVKGDLKVTAKTIRSDALSLTSDKLNSRLTLLVDLVTGRYDVGFAGALERFFIPGLGVVDVKTDLKIMPGAGGKGTLLAGRGQAWVRRFDNSFLAGLAGGLPQLETNIVRDAGGIIRFTNLRLTARDITLTGNGLRRLDGTFQFEASGRQATYGPIVRLLLDGAINRPKLDILFARPNAAMGLTNVRLLLEPDPKGYLWQAAGGSTLGAFTGNGAILLPAGAVATINVAQLDAGGLTASGVFVSATGGLDGRLTLGGNGLSGTLDFRPVGGVQQIEAHVKANGARLEGPPRITARRGQFDGLITLDQGGLSVDATVAGQGLTRGGLSLARLTARVKLKRGSGEITASLAGANGRAFDVQTVTQVSPDAFELIGSGRVDRKPIRLNGPARLQREGNGWRLAATVLEFAGGSARFSGLFGGATTEVDAAVTQLPLTLVDVIYPELGLGGNASGTLVYRAPTNGTPTGKADIRVRGLSRSGLVVSSKPIDVGIAAVLGANSAAARAIAVSGGQTIGRGQVRLSLGGGTDIGKRLANAPMLAQLRFNGPADTLWRLTGVETVNISGAVAIGADIRGTPSDPRISGSMRTAGARVESPITGMVLTNVKASGRFSGSSLTISDFSATAGPTGSVSGRGTFDLSSTRGFAMDIAMTANKAKLIARDELGATVTGPITLKSDQNGGLISGDVLLDTSSYQLGRATTAVAALPLLNVTKINRRNEDVPSRKRASDWQFAIKARAPGRLAVTGLGLDSEWRANLEISGFTSSPTIRGKADLVRGGYEFAGRRFDLSRGSLNFQGASPPDPIIDIVANGDTQGLSATIRVTGTGLKPEILFSSSPALPQDELLSRLLFGTSITNLSAPEAVQLASAVASLQGGGNGLNPINALRRAIGLDRLRILPADTATGQGTSIAAGKYITRRAYLEIITDGQGYSATRAEFQITRWLSLLSTISSIGRQSATIRATKDY